MSVSGPRRPRLTLALALISTAVIAACDGAPTQPVRASRVKAPSAHIDGDTLACKNGWIVVEGKYVCNDE